MRFLAALLAPLLALGVARADEPEHVSAGVIGFLGDIVGGGLTLDNLLPRQHIEASYGHFVLGPDVHVVQAMVMQPFWIDGSVSFGARLGYAFVTFAKSDGSGDHRDVSHSLDASLAFQLAGEAGRFGVELGPSFTFRGTAYHCCDNGGLDTSSGGVRVGVYGELAFGNAGAFAAVSLRTGDILSEIRSLPLLTLGFFVRI